MIAPNISNSFIPNTEMPDLSKIRIQEQVNESHEDVTLPIQSNYRPGGGGIDYMKNYINSNVGLKKKIEKGRDKMFQTYAKPPAQLYQPIMGHSSKQQISLQNTA